MKWDTDNINAPHTLRELGIDPPGAGGVDVSTEAVTRLMEALARGVVECGLHEDGDTELFLVDDANETMADASMAVKALISDRDRLSGEVARLTAELAASKAGAVKVKPLVWEEYSVESMTAATAFGEYVVETEDDGAWGMWTPNEGEGCDPKSSHKTEHAAKAAAQRDYDSITRAAIEPAQPAITPEALTVDDVERIIKSTEPAELSDRGDNIWTRRMACALHAALLPKKAASHD